MHGCKVIRSCKRYITENGRTTIWNQERDVIEVKLTECVKLNDHYRLEAEGGLRIRIRILLAPI